MQFKHSIAAAALALASTGALAGDLTGNAGIVSDYMFRGIDQSVSGAAVQGGADYGFDMGAYAGAWATNSSVGGGNELDLYGGYEMKLGQFTLDGGLIGYVFSEDTENGLTNHNFDYAELYVGGTFGPFAAKLFLTPNFGRDAVGDKDSAAYLTTSVLLTIDDTITITPQLGFSDGTGVKDAYGHNYVDGSVTATKKLKDDWFVSAAVVATTLKDFNGVAGNSDNPKFVVGIKKTFAI